MSEFLRQFPNCFLTFFFYVKCYHHYPVCQCIRIRLSLIVYKNGPGIPGTKFGSLVEAIMFGAFWKYFTHIHIPLTRGVRSLLI